jgi:hypothetical protein
LHVKLDGIILTKQSMPANWIHIMTHMPFPWNHDRQCCYCADGSYQKFGLNNVPLKVHDYYLVYGRHTSMQSDFIVPAVVPTHIITLVRNLDLQCAHWPSLTATRVHDLCSVSGHGPKQFEVAWPSIGLISKLIFSYLLSITSLTCLKLQPFFTYKFL